MEGSTSPFAVLSVLSGLPQPLPARRAAPADGRAARRVRPAAPRARGRRGAASAERPAVSGRHHVVQRRGLCRAGVRPAGARRRARRARRGLRARRRAGVRARRQRRGGKRGGGRGRRRRPPPHPHLLAPALAYPRRLLLRLPQGALPARMRLPRARVRAPLPERRHWRSRDKRPRALSCAPGGRHGQRHHPRHQQRARGAVRARVRGAAVARSAAAVRLSSRFCSL